MVDFGIHFQKITNRGNWDNSFKTNSSYWASDEFKQFQSTRTSSVPSNFIIHVGRGIQTMKMSDIDKCQTSSNIKDHMVVMNRGTKIRRL